MGLPLLVIGALIDEKYADSLATIDGVKLFGQASQLQTRRLLADASHLIWTPEVPEPSGRVVWEALAVGTPVIGSRFGALWDLDQMGACEDVESHFVSCRAIPRELPSGYNAVATEYVELYRALS
jgi:hypothetical protein